MHWAGLHDASSVQSKIQRLHSEYPLGHSVGVSQALSPRVAVGVPPGIPPRFYPRTALEISTGIFSGSPPEILVLFRYITTAIRY